MRSLKNCTLGVSVIFMLFLVTCCSLSESVIDVSFVLTSLPCSSQTCRGTQVTCDDHFNVSSEILVSGWMLRHS